MTFRKPGWALVGAVLVGAAVALLLSRGTPPSVEDSARSDSAARPPSASGVLVGTSSGMPSPNEPKLAVEQLPMPGCWDGLRDLDKTATLDSLREALGVAVGKRDNLLASYLQERLTEVVGQDAGRGLQVVEWAKQASPPELGLYLDALKAAPAVHDAKVSEALLKLGEDRSMPLQNRSAALDALETQRRLSPSDLARLKAVALDETADSTAWVATRTLGRVMKEDFERTGTHAPYWKELLSIAGKSDDMAVRLLALEMPSYSNPLIGSESFDELQRILTTDRERDVREMAAFRLGVTREPEEALKIYEAAFEKEHDVCVRWAIFRFAVRAAGEKALPLLARLAAKDPRFQRDYAEFKQLYASGTVDFARIWLGKGEHHACLVEEGAPH
ncbi:HEAT repeat domain-containing protein [Myxococcus sp. CA040A]|uniref:HEAT repeat domain-containing protein n=1 Tax=Myxococcus sp. CA040A TaxID=2741738 RepID=UPI00157A70D7|nr:HEAT repeat domain-containing protein [Myxococcus sp. CA040A]NTX03267.1 HEAT repeat domain-containing protein [Myxococcus sp. CA040A]